ncbi:DUF4761 family protein, partial [Escherichia coli]
MTTQKAKTIIKRYNVRSGVAGVVFSDVTQRRSFRTGTERHAARFSTSASRSNTHYSLQETHATPDGHLVK